ncbi:NAD-dependent epimerase/dehydratase [Desulforamulus reducens MI-1]|uniref:NAD-dependent epimerase/dehydratase n=1 Tax=Desulforamulus reducens (strain ATCC BAA-1160 / DSM 100696 / MI-1) TaxID=349161 RepID=A4J2H2_DESRM|nr:NAD-dependent epimerase/dehydratase family protein [Desulforamulus reducens]ABO49275.1 NAD-dependent epimerase/dehydratase [Desulforamulus reducens MI-1]
MKVLITGGTGFVGSSLVKHLAEHNHQVVVVSRQEYSPQKSIAYSRLPESEQIFPRQLLAQTDAIINLGGHNISQGRWSKTVKNRILESRLQLTEKIVKSIRKNKEEGLVYPKVLVNASAVGYYGIHSHHVFSEESQAGQGFLAEVCRRWEEAAQEAEKLKVRVVILRLGVVLVALLVVVNSGVPGFTGMM